MAFLPEKTYIEETIANAYTLVSGPASFQSSDLSRFTNFSLHFTCTSIAGDTDFVLDQSNDGSSWAALSEEYQIPIGSSNFVIDKSLFTGKYVRVHVKNTGTGDLTIKLVAKR
jgi:hypothetical protein